MNDHTKEPWKRVDYDWHTTEKYDWTGKIEGEDGTLVYHGSASFHSIPKAADADRIVACVNACAGINPEAVPDLLEALQSAEERILRLMGHAGDVGCDLAQGTLCGVRAALQKAGAA